MVWFFARDSESLKIETTHDRLTGTFTLDTFAADGTLLDSNYLHVAAWLDAFNSVGHSLRTSVTAFLSSMVRAMAFLQHLLAQYRACRVPRQRIGENGLS